MYFFFFFNDTATTEIYTLSLHDALPILQQKGVVIKAEPPAQPSLLGSLLLSLLPIALMIGIVVWLSRNAMNKQGGGLMSIGKSKAKLLTEAHGRVTFDDVAGIDEAEIGRGH